MDAYPHYNAPRRQEYWQHDEQAYQSTLQLMQNWSVDFRNDPPPPQHHSPPHYSSLRFPPPRPLPAPPLNMATIPISSYESASEYLKLCSEQSNLRAMERIPIDLSICDVEGLVQKHRIPGKLFLTSSSDIMGVIMAVQLEVDIVGDTIYHNAAKAPGVLKEKLLIRGFNIIIGDAMAGMPSIAGELFGGDGEKTCKFVRWYCDGGVMQQFWEHYRNWLLKVCDSASTPALFKIFTVKRDGAGQIGMSSGGHHFVREAEPVLLMERMSIQDDFAGHETLRARATYDDRGNTQQEPDSDKTPAQKSEMRARTRYSRDQMEEMVRGARRKKLEHQPSIADSEIILGLLIAFYYSEFTDQPSMAEMEDMEEEIRANGFGTRPVLIMMEDESKNAYVPDTPTKVPKQTEEKDGEQAQDRYYKQPDGWSYYQTRQEDSRLHALYNLDNAQYQPSVLPEFLEPGLPEYEDPVDKVKSKGKERDPRDMPGGQVNMMAFNEVMKYEAYVLRKEATVRVFKTCGAWDEEYAKAKGFYESDDEIYLKPEGAGEDQDDENMDGPSSDNKALHRTNVTEVTQASEIEQYSQFAVPSYNNPGYGGPSSGYNSYSAGGSQYQHAPRGRNPLLSQLHSSTPARVDHGGFPQLSQYNYNSTPGQTNFNPNAATWNSGAHTGGAHTGGYTAPYTEGGHTGGYTGAHTLSGNPTSRFNFSTAGSVATFNPNVPTFQSQTNPNPIVPSFKPKAVGNMPNPLQLPHNQANTGHQANTFATGGQASNSFVSSNQANNSFDTGNNQQSGAPFGHPGPNPFTMKYPLRFLGPGTPVNPNYRPPPVEHPVVHTAGPKPKQSTPLKEFTTNEDENIAPGAAGDMQYGTSMRLYNNRGSNSKSTLSAILNAEPSSSGAAVHASGFGQTMSFGPTMSSGSGQASGFGQASAFGQASSSAQATGSGQASSSGAIPIAPSRRNNKNRHNRGGSAGSSSRGGTPHTG